MTHRPDGGTSYKFGSLRLHLYDTYLIWSKEGISREESHIDYEDIISVRYKNGSFISSAEFQINTTERVFKSRFKCVARGFESIAEDINQRRGAAPAPAVSDSAISPAQQILEYKQLLDAGIITASEFEAKKKQLLDL